MPTDLPPLPEPAIVYDTLQGGTDRAYTADQLRAFGHACRVVDAQMVERALRARVPGGAEVWWWLPQTDQPGNNTPHETARAVMRAALTAALGGSP